MTVYLGLFLSAFISATLLPGTSEVLLLALYSQGYDPILLWCWATAGNTLGSVVNWVLGRYLLHYQDRSWFPVKRQTMESAQSWFQRYGVWSLLLAWAPVVGDGLTLLAGILRVRFEFFIVLTALGKGIRYAILLGIGLSLGW